MGRLHKICGLRSVALTAVLLAAGLGMSGCATLLPPPADPAILAGLQTLKTDEAALFGQLQQPAPACLYPAASSLFAKVEIDILKTETAATANSDSATARGLADLDTALGDLKTGLSGGTTCTPDIMAKQQKLLDSAVDSLISNEQNRAKGG